MSDVQTICGDDDNDDSLPVEIAERVVAGRKCCRRARQHKCLQAAPSQFPALERLLPLGYDYIICEYEALDSSAGGEECFCTVIRVAQQNSELSVDSDGSALSSDAGMINSAAEAEHWLQQFEAVSHTTWRVDKTYPDTHKKLFFKKDYRCHCNTRPSSHRSRLIKGPHLRHTNCMAKLSITIKRFLKYTRSLDPHLRTNHTMVIALRQAHNHAVMAGDSLRHRPVSAGTRQLFIKMFASGMTPREALEMHQSKLRAEHGKLYQQVVVDRSICPDIHWCYRLYYKIRRTNEITGKPSVIPAVYSEQQLNARDTDRPSVTPGVYSEQRITSAEQSVRERVDDWCARIRRLPDTFLPVVERLISISQEVTTDEDLLAGLTSLADRLDKPSRPSACENEPNNSQEVLQKGSSLVNASLPSEAKQFTAEESQFVMSLAPASQVTLINDLPAADWTSLLLQAGTQPTVLNSQAQNPVLCSAVTNVNSAPVVKKVIRLVAKRPSSLTLSQSQSCTNRTGSLCPTPSLTSSELNTVAVGFAAEANSIEANDMMMRPTTLHTDLSVQDLVTVQADH